MRKLVVVREDISTNYKAWSSEPVVFNFYYDDQDFCGIPLSAVQEIYDRLGSLLQK